MQTFSEIPVLTLFHVYFSLLFNYLHRLLEELIVAYMIKKSPILFWTRKSIALFTRTANWTLSRAKLIQSMPSVYFFKICFNIILLSHLHLDLLGRLLLLRFLIKTFYAFVVFSVRSACTMFLIFCIWLQHSLSKASLTVRQQIVT
jgi:hypothetical protein